MIIRKAIPSYLRLPADTEDIVKFYHLMSIEGRVSAKHQQIIFCIRIPLYSHEQFELLRIVPVPFESNSTIIIIHSVAEYLIINLHRDQYYPITKSDLKECVIYAEEFICKQHQPLLSKESNENTCEVNIINHWSWSKSCETKLASLEKHWIQLLQPNQWIYSIFKKKLLTVVYNETSTNYELNGTGVVELQPGCSIKDSGITITGHNIYTTKMKKSIIPSRTISEFINTKPPEEIIFQHNIETNMVEHFKSLKDDIKRLQANERLSSSVSHHDVHHYSVLYISFGVVLVVICIWWWRRRQQNETTAGEGETATSRRPSFSFPSTV